MLPDEVKKILDDTIIPSSMRDFGSWYEYMKRELNKVGYDIIITELTLSSYKYTIRKVISSELDS